MAAFLYYVAGRNLFQAGDAANDSRLQLDQDTLKVMLVGSTTTADTEKDVEFLDEFTTLGETTASGYSRQTLSGGSVNNAGPPFSSSTYFDATDVTFSSLGGGVSIQAAVLFKFVTDDTDSFPIAYFDGNFPVTVNGGDLVLVWAANGLLSIA